MGERKSGTSKGLDLLFVVEEWHNIFMFLRRFLFLSLFLLSAATPFNRLRSLYNSLDPSSVSQHFAYYHLYKDSPLGQQALRHAISLLSGAKEEGSVEDDVLPEMASIENMVALVYPIPAEEPPILTQGQIEWIGRSAKRLPHKKKKGHWVTTEEEVLALPSEEIDLAHALLIALEEENRESYETRLDLMALQILARTSLDASPQEKVREISRFVFEEMGFKFPPHSLYAKDVDKYTFLPSVLDSQRGICLGVSILYVCLAQRLGLCLEMITPPGHIYVRYREGEEEINIETTARGIHLDSEHYLNIDTRSLEERDTKEMVGLAFFNQAALYWEQDDYEKALKAYRRAEPYIPGDKLMQELKGYQLLLLGQKEEGRKIMEAVADYLPDYAVVKHSLAEDFLLGRVDIEGIRTIFLHVDETRKSVLEKKEKLEHIVQRFPAFREGIFHLAIAWLQLHREKEALAVLERYHALDPNHPIVEYYLSVLYLERLDYLRAWEHYHHCVAITAERDHYPRALRNVERELRTCCPQGI